MLTWDRFQEEQRIWSDRNFGAAETRPKLHPLYGMIEEIGEFSHATLKAEQKIRGDAAKHATNRKDAVGDIMVFLTDFLTLQSWKYEDIGLSGMPADVQRTFALPVEADAVLTISHLIGCVAQTFDPHMLGIRAEVTTVTAIGEAKKCLARLVRTLAGVCTREGWEFQEVIETTWNNVKKRDWTKNRQTGDSPTEPEKRTIELETKVDVTDVAKVETKSGGGKSRS